MRWWLGGIELKGVKPQIIYMPIYEALERSVFWGGGCRTCLAARIAIRAARGALRRTVTHSGVLGKEDKAVAEVEMPTERPP